METKVGTLPSTKSNKICSLLTTDLHDSNLLTKEKEEELLNDTTDACDEDIDEDEALSDDSLRLKLSDDDEPEQDDIDSAEFYSRQLTEGESDEDKKHRTHEERFAKTSEEEKDSCEQYKKNSVLEEEHCSSEDTTNQVKTQSQEKLIVSDDLKKSENPNSVESVHDQDITMNGNDPRFYPNVIRPMYENRWNSTNHRSRMGFNSRPPPPPPPQSHQRSYYPNSNYNASDIEPMSNRYYNNKHQYYSRARGTHNYYNAYNFSSKTVERKKESPKNSSTFKSNDVNSSVSCSENDNEDESRTAKEKREHNNENSTERLKETKLSNEIDIKVEGVDVKDDEISSTSEEVIKAENAEEEKEKEEDKLNNCPTDSSESGIDKTVEATPVDLPNSSIDIEADITVKEEPSTLTASNEELEKAADFPVDEINKEQSTIPFSLEENDKNEDSHNETSELANNFDDSDNSSISDNSKETSNKMSKESSDTDLDTLKFSDDNAESYEDNLEDMEFEISASEEKREFSPKLDQEKVAEEEEDESSQKTEAESNKAKEPSSISINDDSGSTMDNLPKVYQCLEEIASMERAQEIKENTRSDELADSSKSQDAQGDNNNTDDCENSHEDVNKDNEDDNTLANCEKSPAIEDNTSSHNESEVVRKSKELLNTGDDNYENDADVDDDNDNDNMDEGENSNLSHESSETNASNSNNTMRKKEKSLQEIEKLNFDENACHPNEDIKKTADNETQLQTGYSNDIKGALIVKRTELITEETCNKYHDTNNDVSSDASSSVNNDASNDVSNDNSTDVQMKLSEADDSNSQDTIITGSKETEDVKLEETEQEGEEEEQAHAQEKGEAEAGEEADDEEEIDKMDTSKDINQIKEIIGVQDEKMIVNDDNLLKDANSKTPEVSNLDDCSSEKNESSTSKTVETKVDSNSEKEENPSAMKKRSFIPLKFKVSETLNKEGERSGRQKRKTAKNAEELIKTKFLKSDSEGESDDADKLVPVQYKKSKLLADLTTSVSPSSLKRNLEDEGEDCNEANSSENKLTFKKIKMTIETPRKSSNERFSFNKEEDKNLESIRNLTSVRKFFQRDIKGQLRKLKQEELEELLIQKIVETITMNSEIGKLREQARLSEKNQEATRAKCQQLAKQMQDFEMVLKRNAADRSSSNDKFVAPIKINRSVGLQVNFISDHGMQNMRQIQQNTKGSTASNASSSSTSTAELNSTPQPRKGIKVRSPRRTESTASTSSASSAGTATAASATTSTPSTPTAASSTNTATPAQPRIPISTPLNPVTPAALVTTKPVTVVEPANRTVPVTLQTINAQQPIISNVNHRSPNKLTSLQAIQQGQTVILNGNRLPTSNPANNQKPKSNNDLIDLTDEEEKTKTAVSTPITLTSATIIGNHQQNQRLQNNQTTHYQRVIQAIPTSVAISGQTTNIRVVQPNSQTTPTALVNNINASRLAYVMQSGGQPRQILIANPNSLRQTSSTTANRNQFSTITYKTANGIPTSANGTLRLVTTQATVNAQISKHPAPLPDSGPCDTNPNWKLPPPAPSLKISKVASGIVLSWNMTLSDKHAEIVSYQLFAYQEVNGTPPSTLLWKKVGDVMALPLPMACTLTQFSPGNNYYFAVRAVDTHSRLGQYSLPGNISL